MASEGSPYDGPVPRPSVVNPNCPYGAVRSAAADPVAAAPDGTAKAVTTSPSAGSVAQMSRRRRVGDLRSARSGGVQARLRRRGVMFLLTRRTGPDADQTAPV